MNKAEKSAAIEELSRIVDTAGVIIVANYAGMPVSEMSDLRLKMRDGGAKFQVAKNRLVKIALQGKPQEAGADLFKGQTGIAYSEDPTAAAKVVKAYVKGNDKFEVLGGILGGSVLDQKGIEALADMPSIEEMRAKLLGTLKAPLAKFAGVLKAPPTKLAGVLKAPPQKLLGVLAAKEAKDKEMA